MPARATARTVLETPVAILPAAPEPAAAVFAPRGRAEHIAVRSFRPPPFALFLEDPWGAARTVGGAGSRDTVRDAAVGGAFALVAFRNGPSRSAWRGDLVNVGGSDAQYWCFSLSRPRRFDALEDRPEVDARAAPGMPINHRRQPRGERVHRASRTRGRSSGRGCGAGDRLSALVLRPRRDRKRPKEAARRCTAISGLSRVVCGPTACGSTRPNLIGECLPRSI